MNTRSVRLLGMALLCSLLPLTCIPADAPVAAAATRLESLLAAHDVRYAIHSPRASSDDCLKTEAERGR
jgi:hypothetical protein